jgi:hypothetical protein
MKRRTGYNAQLHGATPDLKKASNASSKAANTIRGPTAKPVTSFNLGEVAMGEQSVRMSDE